MSDTNSTITVLIVLLLIATGVAMASKWVPVPYTLALVVVGLVISPMHFLPPIHISPDLILLIFLPALLFDAALDLGYVLIEQASGARGIRFGLDRELPTEIRLGLLASALLGLLAGELLRCLAFALSLCFARLLLTAFLRSLLGGDALPLFLLGFGTRALLGGNALLFTLLRLSLLLRRLAPLPLLALLALTLLARGIFARF
jgi:hypothetical protein